MDHYSIIQDIPDKINKDGVDYIAYEYNSKKEALKKTLNALKEREKVKAVIYSAKIRNKIKHILYIHRVKK